MLYTDSSRGRSFAKDPAVVWYAGRYLMYYSIPAYGDGRPGDGLAIGIAESQDLEAWRRIGEIAPQADYEKNGLCAPGALVHDGRLHLFYQMYGNGPRDAICHAVSDDGLHFVRNATNPIIRPSGAWNCGRAIDADVVVDGERLLLYWATRDPAMRVQMLGVSGAPLGSAFGRDDWVQLCEGSILAPELAWEQGSALRRRPCAGTMAGSTCSTAERTTACRSRSGCAVSDDGVLWKRLSAEPFQPNGPAGSLERLRVGPSLRL